MIRKQSIWAILLVFISTIAACQIGAPDQAQEQNSQDYQDVSTTLIHESIWFDSLDEKTTLSDRTQKEIAAWVFDKILNESNISAATLPVEYENERPSLIFASLSDGKSKAGVFHASGENTGETVANLLHQIEGYLQKKPKPVWIKIDFVDQVIPQKGFSFSEPNDLPRSLFGLAFKAGSEIALLPEVLVAETIIDSKQTFRLNNLIDYQADRGGEMEFLETVLDATTVMAFRFSTNGYFYEEGSIYALFRGHRMFTDISRNDLLPSAIAGGDYLIDAVFEDGKFVYSYFPKSDRESDSYNILRHAGTIYAMIDLYQETNDLLLLDAASRAIGYLMTTVEQCPVGNDFENCVVEDGKAKLGGNGLSVLALSQYMQATGSRDFLDEAQSLARWIISNQAASGEFTTHILAYPSGEVSDTISAYYPGEAIFALAKLYAIDGDPRWLEAAVRGARWLSDDRINGKQSDEITHDHWLLLGLDALQHIQPDPVFVESALQIAEAIIASQNIDPVYPDWYGSYYDPPRSTPTATRSEGLLAAYRIARDFGTADQAEIILQAATRNIAFQLSTQFRPETVMYLPDPVRSLGGFHRDLTNFEIRNDYVQHNISSLLALYRALP